MQTLDRAERVSKPKRSPAHLPRGTYGPHSDKQRDAMTRLSTPAPVFR
jgi:hypothetical protein